MAEKSIYSRGGNGMTTGGLDGYLGPQAQDFSNLPEHLDEGEKAAADAPLDCHGADRGESVCQIADAKKELRKNSK